MFERVLNMHQVLNASFWLHQNSKYASGSEYATCSEYASGSQYPRVLNMPGLHKVMNSPEYAQIIPIYAWKCLNMFADL